MVLRRWALAAFAGATALLVVGCSVSRQDWLAIGTHGMVASDSAWASHAGLEILRAGGNAVDAATAVSFALGVTRPYSTGCGGGGFTMIRFAGGRIAGARNVVLDYREVAPARSTPDMYTRATSRHPERLHPSRNGHLAVGVPGLVAGRCLALTRYGTMSLDRVLQPAIRLARDGFAVDEHYRDSSREALRAYRSDPTLKSSCGYVYRVHLNDGKLHSVGDRLRQATLARFLERLGRDGSDFFYRGAFAEALERSMVRHGGVIDRADLAGYRVRHRAPIMATYHGYTIVTMPPPSSGGVALTEALHILEPLDLPRVHRDDPALAWHYVVEAMKHAFADRSRWLADADFVSVPVEALTSRDYGRRLSARIDPNGVGDPGAYGSMHIDGFRSEPVGGASLHRLPDDHGTSHFCVVDRFGNVVVSTETINTSFGSLAAVDGWGVILNNEMDDFTAVPGVRNAYGLMQSDRNAVAPGKRPLSSMSPTIVLKNDEPYLLIGASGGPRIISSVLDVMLNLLDFDRSLDEALSAPRVHHQWQPNEVAFDRAPPPSLTAGLSSRGHFLSERRVTGIVQAIVRAPWGWRGVSDPRKGGRPAGY